MTQPTKHEAKSESQAPSPPATAASLKPPKPLPVSAIGLAEYTTRRHTVTLPPDTPVERVEQADFWANVADRLRPGDSIEVHCPKGSFFAELYVREICHSGGVAKAKSGAIVHVLRHVKFEPIEHAKQAATHEVAFLGPNPGWGVVRIADQAIVIAGLPDKETAQSHMHAMRS
jgi:hypothetical protein